MIVDLIKIKTNEPLTQTGFPLEKGVRGIST
jgi:hypothetical protein